MLSVSRTAPFRRLQAKVGFATFHINTIAVGLELVAQGGTKPHSLNIKWDTPKNPRSTIEQTKHFALIAVLTLVVDAFDNLLREYGQSFGQTLPKEVSQCLIRASKNNGADWSIVERAQAFCSHVDLDAPEEMAFLNLTVAWRNALVHTSRAKWILSVAAKDVLLSREGPIRERYAALEIERCISGFEAKRVPTLKEATTMVAVLQNLSRSMDEKALQLQSGTPELLTKFAKQSILEGFETSKGGWRRIWGRDLEARKRALKHFLEMAGFHEAGPTPSNCLPTGFLNEIASLDMEQVENHLRESA